MNPPTSRLPSSPQPRPATLARRARLLALLSVAAAGLVALACNEGEPESDVLEDVPLFERQADGSMRELDGTEELAEALEIELDLPEELPPGLSIQQGVVTISEGVLQLDLRDADGQEALMLITRDAAGDPREPAIEIDGVPVAVGEAGDTDETVYSWTSCRQNYALQAAGWDEARMEEVVRAFINSCDQPGSPPAS